MSSATRSGAGSGLPQWGLRGHFGWHPALTPAPATTVVPGTTTGAGAWSRGGLCTPSGCRPAVTRRGHGARGSHPPCCRTRGAFHGEGARGGNGERGEKTQSRTKAKGLEGGEGAGQKRGAAGEQGGCRDEKWGAWMWASPSHQRGLRGSARVVLREMGKGSCS